MIYDQIEKDAVSVECWMQRCYCDLVRNVVYDNFQDILVPESDSFSALGNTTSPYISTVHSCNLNNKSLVTTTFLVLGWACCLMGRIWQLQHAMNCWFFLVERNVWSTPKWVLMAHTEWLPGVWLRHSVPPEQYTWKIVRVGGCWAVLAQWQSTGGSSQRCPGWDSQGMLAFPQFSSLQIHFNSCTRCNVDSSIVGLSTWLNKI